MKGRRFLQILIILIIYTTNSYSATKMRIAIIDFKSRGVSKAIANTITELIRTEMINTGKYVVIERGQMGEILKEQGLQQTGCTDISCAVEVGKLLSAKKMLIGNVLKLGKMIIINGRIVDVEKGVAQFGQKQNAKSEDDLYNAVSLFTKNLTKRIRGNTGFFASADDENEKKVEPEEEEEDLPPILIPGMRFTLSGTMLKPQGTLGSDVASEGLGLSLNMIMSDFLFTDSLFMVNFTYAQLTPDAEWVDGIDYTNLSLNLGFPMNIIRRLTVTPYLGGGYIMFTTSNDQAGYDATGNYSYTKTSYFDPMASARLEFSIIFTSSIQLVLTPSYIFYFEKSGTQQMLTADAGFRLSF